MSHSKKSIARAMRRQNAEIRRAEKKTVLEPHVGAANRKTHCLTEGTSAGVACAQWAREGEHACLGTCYALWKEDVIYPACRVNHAENLVCRRRDPVRYYQAFFAAANETPDRLLRLSETGDVETVRDVVAIGLAARAYPHVRAIIYSRRYELMDAFKALPKNVRVRMSAYTCPVMARKLVEAGILATSVVEQHATGSCPAIARARVNKARTKAGAAPLPAWSCADCARKNVGCWGAAPMVSFPKH